jgi:hypothetical protein
MGSQIWGEWLVMVKDQRNVPIGQGVPESTGKQMKPGRRKKGFHYGYQRKWGSEDTSIADSLPLEL